MHGGLMHQDSCESHVPDLKHLRTILAKMISLLGQAYEDLIVHPTNIIVKNSERKEILEQGDEELGTKIAMSLRASLWEYVTTGCAINDLMVVAKQNIQ